MKNNSYIREWANKKLEELRYSNDITPENLFAVMMIGLSAFAKDDPIGNDASLFEVGCYLYFRIDMWLFLNKPDLRKLISTIFIREFNKLFTIALNIDNVADLFAERVDKYGELARNKEDIQQYHFFLSQLIARTKDNAPPQKCNFGKESFSPNFFGDTFIEIELISWEQAMMPVLMDSLKKYCDLMEKKSYLN